MEVIILKQLWINLSRRFSPPSKSFIVFKEFKELLQIVEIKDKDKIIKILDKLEEDFREKQ